MSYSKLIFQYMDGELGGVQEDLLFTELARDPALREEFNQHMKLDQVSRQDMTNITAPAESTSMIFSSLGFSIPNEGLSRNVVPQASVAKSLVNMWKKHLNIVLSSLSAAAVAVLIYGGVTSSSDETQVAEVASETVAIVQENTSQVDRAPIVSNIVTAPPVKSSSTTIVPAKEDNSVVPVAAPVQNVVAQRNIPDIMEAKVDAASPYSFNTRSENHTFTAHNLIEIISNIKLPVSNMSIMAGYNANSAMGNMDLNRNHQWYNDMYVSVLYGINDYIVLGVELGSADFDQKFNQPGPLGLDYQRKQNVQALYGGFLTRLNMHWLSTSAFCPYVQGFAGACEYGPLAKLELGGIYKIGSWNLNCGVEYGRMFYSAYGKSYNSDNLGMKVGLSYDITK